MEETEDSNARSSAKCWFLVNNKVNFSGRFTLRIAEAISFVLHFNDDK